MGVHARRSYTEAESRQGRTKVADANIVDENYARPDQQPRCGRRTQDAIAEV